MSNKFLRTMPPLPAHVTFIEMLKHSMRVLHCNGFMTDAENRRIWARVEKEYLKEGSKEISCDICGDCHEIDSVPLSCQTGDGE